MAGVGEELDIPALPKVLLHDHLDGGLRPETVLELADAVGHALPHGEPAPLRQYFRAGAESGDLLQYLDTFQHTLAVLQTTENLERVAAECVEDLAADGVVYAEVRYAPELHGEQGLSLREIAEAVDAGFARGMAEAAAGQPIVVNTIMCGMRMFDRSAEVARLAVESRDRGLRVVGFDLAGAETGFPPSDHLDAIDIAKRGLLGITIHASEPPGLELISDALGCGADRVGHGVRLIEDCSYSADGRLALGPLATYVRDRQIPLELAPTCNVQIGAVPTLSDHPIGRFLDLGFRVTVNTDNRLMSGVSAGSELEACADAFSWGCDELGMITLNGIRSSFASYDERLRIERDVIAPAYA